MLAVRPGARVYLHQAFRCCPYAGTVSSQTHDYLVANGYVITRNPLEAEVCVVNTCGSDARQAELTWEALAAIRANGPERAVVVTGCLVSIEPKALGAALAELPHHARFDPRHLSGLDEVFAPSVVPFADVQPALHNEYAGNDFAEGWLHVLASTGCLGTCAFCAIRRATGRPRSTPIAGVLAEMARGLEAGRHDQLLVSTDLSAWGTDLGTDVVALLEAVTDAPGDLVLGAESFEPTLFLDHFERLLPLFSSGRWAFIGLPIQSGSARVLRSMERTYDPEDVVRAVDRLRAAAPELVVRTDLLYGFGDETDAEFDASVRVSRAFSLPSFNAYQQRPGTPPVQLPLATLSARRERALAEMQARALAGLPPLRRWGVTPTPRPLPADVSPVEVPADAPWLTAAGAAWIAKTTAQFTALVARKGPVTLGVGWALTGAEARPDAVALRLQGPGGGSREVGLRAPEWPGAALARSERFAAWVLGPATLDGAEDAALKRLFVALGLG